MIRCSIFEHKPRTVQLHENTIELLWSVEVTYIVFSETLSIHEYCYLCLIVVYLNIHYIYDIDFRLLLCCSNFLQEYSLSQ